MARIISVTQLKRICLEPELLGQWLRGAEIADRPIERGECRTHGKTFHDIARDFERWLRTRGPEADRLADAQEIWDACWQNFGRERLLAILQQGDHPGAQQLTQALENWCRSLAVARGSLPSFRSWGDLLALNETGFDRVALFTQEGDVYVNGRPDSVRATPNGFTIVDYKLNRGATLEQDLLQVAIYTRMLRVSNPTLPFTAALEYYDAEPSIVRPSAEELASLFDAKVQPVLERIARQTARAHRVLRKPQTSPELKNFADRIIDAYQSFDVPVSVLEWQDAPQLTRFRLLPAEGVSYTKLAWHAVNLQIKLGLDHEPQVSPGPGAVHFDVLKTDAETVRWREAVQRQALEKPGAGPVFAIGMNLQNELILAELTAPNSCHVLVAGASGSGKSEWLKSVVASLAHQHSPRKIRLGIVDPKILTFTGMEHSRWLWQPVVHDLAGAVLLLQRAITEMENRYQRLAQEQVLSLADLWQNDSCNLPFILLVFDEFADLLLGEKDLRKEFENLVVRLASKGRAAGIHLMLATQRPDRNVVTGPIKANLPLKICFRVTSAVNSQIVLDESGAEKLLGKGDLLCDRGRGLERAQGPFIPQAEFLKVMGA
jgi:DNA segregation ATPase FtsK/SpoIIIE, S-DNA-T family